MSEIIYSDIDYISVDIKPEFPFSFGVPVAIAEEIFTWVHEFTEAAIFEAIRGISFLYLLGAFHASSDSFTDYIPIYHIMASLCTDSLVLKDRLSPDEFWVWLQEVRYVAKS